MLEAMVENNDNYKYLLRKFMLVVNASIFEKKDEEKYKDKFAENKFEQNWEVLKKELKDDWQQDVIRDIPKVIHSSRSREMKSYLEYCGISFTDQNKAKQKILIDFDAAGLKENVMVVA